MTSPMDASDDQVKALQEAFKSFDLNNDGKITAAEMSQVYRSAGRDPDEAQIKGIIAKADKDQNGTIEFNEFIDIMVKNDKKTDKEKKFTKELSEMFKLLDKNGDGVLSDSELRIAISRVRPNLDMDGIEDMMRDAEFDDQGKMAFEEFVKFMRS